MFWPSRAATCWRLLERDQKIPRMRNDRQMIVIEKRFRVLNCHRLLRATRTR
jgi:hypothetical protein